MLSGYKPNEFDWEKYLEACNAQAAPKNLFKSQSGVSSSTFWAVKDFLSHRNDSSFRYILGFSSQTSSTAMFEVGMKLEAVDRKNPCLVCVASVADIVDNRFLVHFDNWDDTYDYW